MKLNRNELLNVYGGTISATLINAIVKGFSVIVDLGKALGSAIRRAVSGKTCPV